MSFDFDLARLLQTIGPTASLLFAAWIFLQYLNQRYIESVSRLRDLAENLRAGDPNERRLKSLRAQLEIYPHRCELMRKATNLGLLAAMLLTATLVMGALVTISPAFEVLSPVGVVCAVAGLVLVMVAAAMVMRENGLIARALDSETMDLD
jgi:hypothetical protein